MAVMASRTMMVVMAIFGVIAIRDVIAVMAMRALVAARYTFFASLDVKVMIAFMTYTDSYKCIGQIGFNGQNGLMAIMALMAIMSVLPMMCVITFLAVWNCLKYLDTLPES